MTTTPVARATDPGTSWAAAQSVRDVTAAQSRVLSLFGESDHGLTDEQLALIYESGVRMFDWPPMSPSGLRTRRCELVTLGKVEDTGRRTTTRSGRSTIVWDAVGEPGLW